MIITATPRAPLSPVIAALVIINWSMHSRACVQVVFGEVLEGMDIVRKIESSPCNANDRPVSPVVIAGAGEL